MLSLRKGGSFWAAGTSLRKTGFAVYQKTPLAGGAKAPDDAAVLSELVTCQSGVLHIPLAPSQALKLICSHQTPESGGKVIADAPITHPV